MIEYNIKGIKHHAPELCSLKNESGPQIKDFRLNSWKVLWMLIPLPKITITFILFSFYFFIFPNQWHKLSTLHLLLLVHYSIFYFAILNHKVLIILYPTGQKTKSFLSYSRHNPKVSFNHLFALLSVQDCPEYFLANPQAWFPNGRHGGAAALWKLPAIPCRPLCRRHLSPLQLPRSSWWPVWQMWASHQCCGAQGELERACWWWKGERRMIRMNLCWLLTLIYFSKEDDCGSNFHTIFIFYVILKAKTPPWNLLY